MNFQMQVILTISYCICYLYMSRIDVTVLLSHHVNVFDVTHVLLQTWMVCSISKLGPYH